MSEIKTSGRRTVGIICEYNPFHGGHAHQIALLRKMGYETVICAMSGNYTERGEIAIADKYTRAEAAVNCGASLVVELPFPYSSLSAEGFARAGVHILAGMGVDTLCFGSESADKALLERAAEVILSEAFLTAYAAKKDTGSAKAYFDLLSALLGEDATLLSNDILAVSYIAAIKQLGCPMEILPIKREGAGYKEAVLQDGEHPSATALRAEIRAGGDLTALLGKIPPSALHPLINAQDMGMAPALWERSGDAVPAFFRLMNPDMLRLRAIRQSGGGKDICADGCGLTERICRSAEGAEDPASLLAAAYNSRYPDARINRVLLFSLFGVSDKFEKSLPSYTTLLAADQVGRAYLAQRRKEDSLTVITKPADAPADEATEILRLSDAFYLSCTPGHADRQLFLKKRPYIKD